jgi:hypothetical protein
MQYSDDIEVRQFRVPVALAAMPREVPAYSFWNWVRRPSPAVLLDEGDHRRSMVDGALVLHFRHVAQVAIVAELVALGMVPRQAGIAASHFTNAGERGKREAGQLYAEGQTVLFVSEDAGPRLANVFEGAQLLPLFYDGTTFRLGFRALWLNPLIGHLRHKLGLPAPGLPH